MSVEYPKLNNNKYCKLVEFNYYFICYYKNTLLFMVLECFTPNDLNGSCINIKSCPPLRTLLETQRTNSTVVTFLRNSMCGYEGKDPKVCCPLDNEPSNNPDTTQRITTSRPDSSGSTVYETVTSIKLPSQKTCGRSNSSHVRIVGGNPAELGMSLKKIKLCLIIVTFYKIYCNSY